MDQVSNLQWLLSRASSSHHVHAHLRRYVEKVRATQGLGGAYPGELYTPSAREFHQPDEPVYPFLDRTLRVHHCGRICIGKRKIHLSTVFAGQLVGIREVDSDVWLVSFLDFDLWEDRIEPADNPFTPKKM